MKKDTFTPTPFLIPEHEIQITTSRSGGAGGQHVNKTDTKVTLHWNIATSTAFTPEQKQLLLAQLGPKLTSQGDLIVSQSSSRSQYQNKEQAFLQLNKLVQAALRPAKKRLKTAISASAKAARLRAKSHQSQLKKARSKKFEYE